MDKNTRYRAIPKVDVLLENEAIRALVASCGRHLTLELIREQLEELRASLDTAEREDDVRREIAALVPAVVRRAQSLCAPRLKKVINATGTIIHTNLGRAPISQTQARRLIALVTGYSNLEYDLENGQRGERYSHFEQLLCRLTGAEAAMAVNNNAAAVMLALSTVARGGQVLVSRGEEVEIGGKFRIPDVCRQSGAELLEVGTTNKTHLSDYAEALSAQSSAILKVHTSNYRIVGFTESVPASELTELAHAHGIPVIEDLGSGVLVDLARYGLSHEPTVQEAVSAGVDIVTFSGDKLLGGPQAGILVGKKRYIEKMKANQLTRALRVDKFTVAALESVLLEYLTEEGLEQRIPVLRMLSERADSVARRAEELLGMLRERCGRTSCALVSCESQTGGGSLPMERLPSFGIRVRPETMRASTLERRLLEQETPVVARIVDDALLLDVRTVDSAEFPLLVQAIVEVLA